MTGRPLALLLGLLAAAGFAAGCATAGGSNAPAGKATARAGQKPSGASAEEARRGAAAAGEASPATAIRPSSTVEEQAGAATASGPAGTSPTGAAAYRVYVAMESADAVAELEGGTWKVLRQIPVGVSLEDIEGVHALGVSPDGRFWYISLAHGFPYGSIWKFAADGDSLVAKTQVGLFPATMGITPDGAWLFVVNYNLHGDKRIDTVSAVYTPSMTEVTQIPACVKPHGLDVSRDGKSVLVTCTRDDTILKIDVGTLKEAMRGSVRLPEEAATGKDCYPTGLQAMPDGSRAYVSCGHANEVRVVDLATLQVTGRIAECKGAYLLRLDPEARRLWVPCRSGQDVVVIDTDTNTIVGRVPTTREFPHTVAFTPDGTHALLTQESKGVIPGAMDVVERKSLKKVTSVDIGLQATGIGIVSR